MAWVKWLNTGIRVIRRRWGYFRTKSHFKHQGLWLDVYPEVLNPTLFTASKVFAKRVVQWLPAEPCDLLELGCGCGLASLVAASKGHRVCAVDVDSQATANTIANATRNHLTLEVIESNWDAALPQPCRFDRIICNPPFLPGEGGPLTTALRAGPNGGKLREVIAVIARRLHPSGRALIMTSSQTERSVWLQEVVKIPQLKSQCLGKVYHWQERLIFDELTLE